MPGTNVFAKLHFLNVATRNCASIQHMAPVFHPPALRTLRLLFFHGRLSEHDWPIPGSVSNVKHLVLDCCFLDSKLVAKILMLIKALETFDYGYKPFVLSSEPSCVKKKLFTNNIWADIALGLQKHTHTLSKLKLLVFADEDDWEEMLSYCINAGTIGSLQNFAQLKTASAQIETLLDLKNGDEDLAQKLPNRPEHLDISIDHPKSHEAHLYRNALNSLKKGVFIGVKREIRGMIQTDLPLRELRLASVFEIMEQAGIDITLGRKGVRGIFRTEDIKEMEADDYEEELPTSNGWIDHEEDSDLDFGSDDYISG